MNNVYWTNIYKEWFGQNWSVMNTLTLVVISLLAIVAVLNFIIAAWLGFVELKNEEDSSRIPIIKKRIRKCIIIGISCAAFPVLWPTLLGILDAAGVGSLVGGEIAFNI